MTEERSQLTLTLLGLLTDSWAILPPGEWDSGLDPSDAASGDMGDMVALGHDLHLVEPGGDYFWVVKDDQPTLRAGIALLLPNHPGGEEMAPAGECGRHGDRWEERTRWTSTALMVEMSRRDGFWGAGPNRAGTELGGTNTLGQLLTILRDRLRDQNGHAGQAALRYLDQRSAGNLIINGQPVAWKEKVGRNRARPEPIPPESQLHR